MPVIAGGTYEQLRVAIGRLMGVVHLSTTTSSVDSSSVVDTTLRGGTNDHAGKWVQATSGTPDGETRQVQSSAIVGTGMDLTTDAFSGTVPSAMTYELWDRDYNPADVLEAANTALLAVYGRTFDPVENYTLHGDRKQVRFDVPSGISMIKDLQYRTSVDGVDLHLCDRLWDAQTHASFTQSLDTQDKKQGSQSLRISITGSPGAPIPITDGITSVDISDKTAIELWIKSTVAVASANLRLILDDTAAGGSAVEEVTITALTADTWHYIRGSLDVQESDSAIVNVGIRYNTDMASQVLHIDHIRAFNSFTEVWDTVPRHLWSINKSAREIVLTAGGRNLIGYAPLKLVGGDEPALFANDASTSEVDDAYIIYRAAGELAAAQGDPRAQGWLTLAEQRRRAMPFLVNVRAVE